MTMKMLKKIVFYIWMKPNNLSKILKHHRVKREGKREKSTYCRRREGKRIAHKGVRIEETRSETKWRVDKRREEETRE